MGYIGVDRGIREHWVYQDAEYFKVWFEMLWTARFSKEPHIEIIGTKAVEVNYAEFIFGRIKWAKRLKVSEQRIRTLIKLLIKEKMIVLVSQESQFTLYRIVNYEKYNHQIDQSQQGNTALANQQSTSSQPAANQQPTTKEESKEGKEGKKVKNEVQVIESKVMYADYVKMTPTQYEKLIKDFGMETTRKYILNIDDWFAQNTTKLKNYSDHSRMIRTWKRRDDEKNGEHGRGVEANPRQDNQIEKPAKIWGRLNKKSLPVSNLRG